MTKYLITLDPSTTKFGIALFCEGELINAWRIANDYDLKSYGKKLNTPTDKYIKPLRMGALVTDHILGMALNPDNITLGYEVSTGTGSAACIGGLVRSAYSIGYVLGTVAVEELKPVAAPTWKRTRTKADAYKRYAAELERDNVKERFLRDVSAKNQEDILDAICIGYHLLREQDNEQG